MESHPTQQLQLGICSWSLIPDDPADLVGKVLQTGIGAVQLALDPLREGNWNAQKTFKILRDNNITVVSGMMAMHGEDYSSLQSIRKTGGVRPDQYWEDNLRSAYENALLAHRFKIPLVTFHAGFIPENADDPQRRVMINRLRTIIDLFENHHIKVAFETGQETASTLLDVLNELNRPGVGVNFDPANMILYGKGNPTEALPLLASRVQQFHIKDALPSDLPGEWGREVPTGEGAVDWNEFARIISHHKITCPLIIEREAGHDRIRDIRAAIQLLERTVLPIVKSNLS